MPKVSSCRCHDIMKGCFARDVYGNCRVLHNTDFPGDCPFAKSVPVFEQDQISTIHKLKKKGRHDLIDGYLLERRLAFFQKGNDI